MPIHIARFLRSRVFLWPVLFAVLWLLATLAGIIAPSERFHIALPISWLFSGLLCGVWKIEKLRHLVPSILICTCAVSFGLWQLVSEQARAIEGVASVNELVWKILHIGSILVLFGLWSKLWQLPLKNLKLTLWKSATRGIVRTLAIVSLAPFVFASFNAHRTKIGNRFDPKSADNLNFETIDFRAEDGARLHGWWIPADKATRKTVVVCHGVGANASVFLGVAPFLHRAGFNVFTFDFRGHGDSSGHTVSFGFHEAADVRAACKYLQNAKNQNALALYGFSMGGGAVLLSFAPRFTDDYKVVRAVIVDSAFAEFEPLVERQFSMMPASWRPLAAGIVGFCSQLEIGVTPARIAPKSVVARITPRPLLIIHGDADQLIPLEQARHLFAAARMPKQLQIVSRAGHCRCRLVAPAIYEKRVTNWLRAALN